MTPLLTLTLAAFTALAWHDHRKAFFVFIGALPVYVIRFDLLGMPTTALEVLFGILFIFWLWKREKRFVDIKGWKLLLLFWITAATVAVFVSPDMRSALGLWKAYFIEPVIFFIMANDILRTGTDRRYALVALAWSAVAVGGFALLQRWTGLGVPPPWDGTEDVRSTAFFGFPNAVGLYLAPLLPLFAAMLVKSGKVFRLTKRNWLWQTAFLLSLAGIAAAKSEGAAVGAAAGLCVMGVIFRRTRWWTVGLAVVAAIGLLLSPARPMLLEKAALEDWSGRVRKEMWVETSHMLKDRPILGAGLAGYPIVFAPYHEAGHIEIFQYPHNIILNIWTELGLAGLIVFALIVAQFFRQAHRNGRDPEGPDLLPVALSAAMIAVLVHGLVDAPYFKNDLAFQFWIIVAIMTSLAAARRLETKDQS